MPTNAIDATHEPAAPPSDADLARKLVVLEQHSLPPNEDDFIADAKWLQSQYGTPAFEPYRGTHIAVLKRGIVGHARNSLQLQFDVARKFGVHPQQVLIVYIPSSIFG